MLGFGMTFRHTASYIMLYKLTKNPETDNDNFNKPAEGAKKPGHGKNYNSLKLIFGLCLAWQFELYHYNAVNGSIMTIMYANRRNPKSYIMSHEICYGFVQ